MPRGGPRTGAGRKPGALTKKTREIAEKAVAQGVTPLDVMLGTMRELWNKAEAGEVGMSGEKVVTPLDYRLQAAEVAHKAAPFVHPKLANIEAQVSGPDGGPVEHEVTMVDEKQVKAAVNKLEEDF